MDDMNLRPLPKKFKAMLDKASREELLQQLHELYSMLADEYAPPSRPFVCESCGAPTADRPQIVGRQPEVMVYPSTCRLCKSLGLGENLPLKECSARLQATLGFASREIDS